MIFGTGIVEAEKLEYWGKRLGVASPGERAAVWAPNSIDWVVAGLAVTYAGGTLVPANSRYTAHEVADIVGGRIGLRELELVTLTPAIRAERRIRSARGALVYRVSPRMSNELGVQTGDVIVQVNRTAVASADDVARAIEMYSGRGPIRIFFEHGGRIYTSDVLIQ